MLDLLVAYDSTGSGTLSVVDFGRLLRGELGSAPLASGGGHLAGLPKPDVTVDDERGARIHNRADIDRDGV